MKPPIGDEILVLAFSTFPTNEILRFKGVTIEALYDMSKIPKYQELLSRCTFDTDGALYSPELEDAIWSLVASGVIATVSGSTHEHYLTHALRVRYERMASKLTVEDLALVKEFSLSLKDQILI